MKTETKATPRDGNGGYNARLITAAAPGLLAVCNAICNELYAWKSSGDSRPSTWTDSRITRLRAIIDKAEGR